MLDKKRMGRPKSTTPKAVKISVRIDADSERILTDYCERKQVSRAEGVRDGIAQLKNL